MSEYHEILAEDKAYLEEIGMRSLLQQFVSDAMEDHPENVYEYMASWAAKKDAAQASNAAHQPDHAYPSEGSSKGAAHSSDVASRPDAALPRHDDSFNIGHPKKEVPGSTSHVPDPEVPSRVIDEVAHAIANDEEL